MNDDPYEVLAISRNASTKEVRSRYLSLARRYHPDVNGGDGTAEWVFKHIQEAYETLRENGGEKAPPPAQPPPRPRDQPRTSRNETADENGGQSRRDSDGWYEWHREERRRERAEGRARADAWREHAQRVRRARWTTSAGPAAAAVAAMLVASLNGLAAEQVVFWGLASAVVANAWLWLIRK